MLPRALAAPDEREREDRDPREDTSLHDGPLDSAKRLAPEEEQRRRHDDRDDDVPDALVVRVVADDVLEVGGERTPYPLPPAKRWPEVEALHVVFRPTDSIERIVQTMTIHVTSGVSLDLGVPPPPPLPPVAAMVPDGSGHLDPDVLRRVLRVHTAAFRRCYEAGLAKNPALEGRLTLSLVIDATGAVTSAEDTPPLADRAVAACVRRHAKTIVFPSPEGGGVSVVYPLVFATVR